MDKTSEKDRINEMIDAVMKVARGDFSVQIERSGRNDDLDSLAVGINMMINDIEGDITERKETEELLKKSEEEFRMIAENIHIGLYYTDVHGNFLYGNDASAEIIGVPKEEVIGKNGKYLLDLQCISKKDYLKAVKLLTLVKLGKKAGPEEFHITRKDGTKRIVEIRVQKIKVNKKTVILGIIEDLTEKKKAEEKIKEQNIQLKKLDELKTSFLNVTSHELRTPMTSIKGYVQMLLNQNLGGISDEQKQGLDVILRNTNRLDSLIQDILDVSRLESGTLKFIPKKTDVDTLVGQTVETMQASADRKEITINADIEKDVPGLMVDELRIKQVMTNLLNNAIKFSPDGTIINVKARKEKNDILFEVQDFGRGIPKDKQDKVFETFYQVDSGEDRKFGGAGLGLAVSKGIVVSHGGRIWVESREGKGSTFSFTLPLKPVKDLEERFKAVDMFGLEKTEEEEND